MNIGAKVSVELPGAFGSLTGTYTGAHSGMAGGAWVRLVDDDSSTKILVPHDWLTEIKPPLPPEPTEHSAVVMVRRHGGAYPYRRRVLARPTSSGDNWRDSDGNTFTWAETCERDSEHAPVQVWPVKP